MGHVVANSPLHMIALVSYVVLGCRKRDRSGFDLCVCLAAFAATSKPSPTRPSEIRQPQTKAETGDNGFLHVSDSRHG
jgi:hypothetical protein